ncbi:hypothetical protein ABER99_20470 [Paenibacillus glucanolyticus]|jgi:hypothetical protein|uniref:Uncharacterized protein n=1 Tax=Paenibacillus glucanolyticus TaxID=59843 RepID=A0A163GH33_9BACL|nr:hypothetical protein [Paenibacillus glucanolyticus]KZS44969.1 hypothetical protein AWU65_03035 [Paenibacillus glucanolyticus]OMF64829.1 hypothetical protein BK142_31380 [Paenibacillus glucanolyticus]
MSDSVLLQPFAKSEVLVVQFMRKTWKIEFSGWEPMTNNGNVNCLCGTRIDGDERCHVRINADVIKTINGVVFHQDNISI